VADPTIEVDDGSFGIPCPFLLLLLLVRTRRNRRRKGHGIPKERLSHPGKRARSEGLAHSGRCELLRPDGIAGASWPPGDGHSLSVRALSDTIYSD
jgi:hypothetical protein